VQEVTQMKNFIISILLSVAVAWWMILLSIAVVVFGIATLMFPYVKPCKIEKDSRNEV